MQACVTSYNSTQKRNNAFNTVLIVVRVSCRLKCVLVSPHYSFNVREGGGETDNVFSVAYEDESVTHYNGCTNYIKVKSYVQGQKKSSFKRQGNFGRPYLIISHTFFNKWQRTWFISELTDFKQDGDTYCQKRSFYLTVSAMVRRLTKVLRHCQTRPPTHLTKQPGSASEAVQ